MTGDKNGDDCCALETHSQTNVLSSRSSCNWVLLSLMTSSVLSADPFWARDLPWPLLGFLRFIYLNQLKADDSFITSLQKCVLGVAAVLSVISLAVPVYNLIQKWDERNEPGNICAYAAYFSYCTLWVVLFAMLKYNKSSPGKLMQWWIFGSWLCIIARTISLPHFPNNISFIHLALVTCTTQPKHSGKLLLLSVAGFILSGYNHAVYVPKDPALPLATLPGPLLYTEVYETIRDQVLMLLVSVFVVGYVVVVVQEAKRLLATAKASAVFAQRVATALGRYDTDSATATLEAAWQVVANPAQSDAGSDVDDGSSAASVDPELLATFETIIDNLRRYRPHLPNWVVEKSDVDQRDEAAIVADDIVSDTENACSPRVLGSDAGVPPLSSAILQPVAVLPALVSGESMKTRVVLARVAFRLGRNSSDIHSAVCHAFVDSVYKIASETSTAVHGFIGDRLIATWNATSVILRPEVAAARFLARLHKSASAAGWNVFGAATSYRARVHLAGQARQSALLVGGDPNEPALAEATRLATTYETMVVNGALRRAADDAIVFRGVGLAPLHAPRGLPARDGPGFLCTPTPAHINGGPVLPKPQKCPPTRPQATRQGLFEIRGERRTVDEGWLYVVETESGENSPDLQLCQAADFAAQADVGIALTSVNCLSARIRAEPIVADFAATLRQM
jgi:hypothetical protein